MLFVGGAHKRHLLMLGLVRVLAIVVLIWMGPLPVGPRPRLAQTRARRAGQRVPGSSIADRLLARAARLELAWAREGPSASTSRGAYGLHPCGTDLGKSLVSWVRSGCSSSSSTSRCARFTIAHRTKDPLWKPIAERYHDDDHGGQALLNIGVITKTLPCDRSAAPIVSMVVPRLF